GGRSHSQTAASLGLAKGTVTKRLAKAREELATRLKRRGITLGVGALSTMIATQAPASVPAPLLLETAKQAVAFSLRQAGGSVACSPDVKTLLTGDTGGEVTALWLPSEPPTYRWRSTVGGSHPALAYSADQKKVYATTTHGVLILDATTRQHVARIDEPDSNP